MSQKTMTLSASLFALLLCASAFAGGLASETPESSARMSSLSVGISGCIASGTGDFICHASASGGSGSYNYWWQHSGSGQLYQTNSSFADVSGCTGGGFTLRVQIVDRVTRRSARSAPFQVSCGGGIGGGGGGIGIG